MAARTPVASSSKRPELPAHATLKDISATYNEDTIPRQFQTAHTLPPDVWAVVVVEDGEVELKLRSGTLRVTADASALIPPNSSFTLTSTGNPLRFCLHYYHEPLLHDGKALAALLGRRVA
jgi:tellurite resistance-related uncharacterized protein